MSDAGEASGRSDSAWLACVDVDYRGDLAVAGCVLFERWEDAAPAATRVEVVHGVAAYRSGHFAERELPALLAVLASAPSLAAVVVDGFVWLAPGVPGLGGHLFERLERAVPVVGVAKRGRPGLERDAPIARAVLRGRSARPLWVSAAGMALDDAVAAVERMHGEHRLPTLLKSVDSLARTWLPPGS
ncbi:MAG: endonuclease V [Myxococcota bacterium]